MLDDDGDACEQEQNGLGIHIVWAKLFALLVRLENSLLEGVEFLFIHGKSSMTTLFLVYSRHGGVTKKFREVIHR